MIDHDDLTDWLFGVQLACIFAFVALGSFAIGWFRGVDKSVGWDNMAVVEALNPQPVPGWVSTALWGVAIVLVVSVVADFYLVLQNQDPSDLPAPFGDQNA